MAPIKVIESIQNQIGQFGRWHPDYLFDSVYGLQEELVRKDLEKLGFDYDKGWNMDQKTLSL